MSVRKVRLCAGVVAIIGITASTVSADPVVLYSNFGSAPGYNQGPWDPSSPVITGAWMSQSQHNSFYMMFQPVETGRLMSLVLPVVWVGNLSTIDVILADGLYPASIEHFLVTAPDGAQDGTVSMLTLTSVLQPTLLAHTTYFLNVVPFTPVFSKVLWPWNNSGAIGTVVETDVCCGNIRSFRDTLSAFQVNGELSPTPEPATFALIATGLGLIAHRRQRIGQTGRALSARTS
jgi:hypothetical protein